MNVGERQGEVFTVEPLNVPVPVKEPVQEPISVPSEEPELVPIKKD